MVSLMFNMDMDIANKSITKKHLDHLPREEITFSAQQIDLSQEAEFPKMSANYKQSHLTASQLNVLANRFHSRGTTAAFKKAWPVDNYHTKTFPKYHIRWHLSIGSEFSQGKFGQRRDDSYISWRAGSRQGGYARVIAFCQVEGWIDYVALIRPLDVPELDMYGNLYVDGSFGPVIFTLATEITGIIGRIVKKRKD